MSDKAHARIIMNKSIKFQAQANIRFKKPRGRAIMIEYWIIEKTWWKDMEKYARNISSPPVEQGIAFIIPVEMAAMCSTAKSNQIWNSLKPIHFYWLILFYIFMFQTETFFAENYGTAKIIYVLIASNMIILVNILNLKAVFGTYPNCFISRSISSHFAITFGHCLANWMKII